MWILLYVTRLSILSKVSLIVEEAATLVITCLPSILPFAISLWLGKVIFIEVQLKNPAHPLSWCKSCFIHWLHRTEADSS